MKELTLPMLLAVFEEIFGRGLFWTLVAAGAVVGLACLYVLARDRAVSWRKFLWAQLAMPVGAVAAVALLLGVTNSRLSDMGGPVDVIVLLGVALLGALGLAVLVYTARSLLRPPPRDARGRGRAAP